MAISDTAQQTLFRDSKLLLITFNATLMSEIFFFCVHKFKRSRASTDEKGISVGGNYVDWNDFTKVELVERRLWKFPRMPKVKLHIAHGQALIILPSDYSGRTRSDLFGQMIKAFEKHAPQACPDLPSLMKLVHELRSRTYPSMKYRMLIQALTIYALGFFVSWIVATLVS